MGWRTIDLLCESCGDKELAMLVPTQEQDGTWECPSCGGVMRKAFLTAPAVMQAAHPDGTRRKGFSELKEAFRLESEAFDLPPEKRTKHNREIRKLRELKK